MPTVVIDPLEPASPKLIEAISVRKVGPPLTGNLHKVPTLGAKDVGLVEPVWVGAVNQEVAVPAIGCPTARADREGPLSSSPGVQQSKHARGHLVDRVSQRVSTNRRLRL